MSTWKKNPKKPLVKRLKDGAWKVSGDTTFPMQFQVWSLGFLFLAEILGSQVHMRCWGQREDKL